MHDGRGNLERFHVLDYSPLLLVRQVRAVQMAAVAVAGHGRVVAREALATGGRDVRDEADLLPIEEIVPAVKHLWSIGWGVEQVPQCRHRAVMEVRGAQPDSVQWL